MKKMIVSILFLSFLIGLMFGGQSSFAATTVDPTGTRIIPTILSAHGENPIENGNGLFDNARPDVYNTNEIFYWYSSADFIELQIDNNFRIWRSGTASWPNSNGKLKLEQWNGVDYTNITSTQPELTSINGTQWELMTTDLPAGKYKMSHLANSRLDSEWYVEQTSTQAKPTSLTATAGNTQATISWTSAVGATGYNVKRSTTASGPYTTIASNVYGSPYTDTTVTNGTTYYYVVTALGSSGESVSSNEASATPTAPTITNRALLVITLVSGLEKEYDLPMTDVNSFTTWYAARAGGSGAEVYMITKTFNKANFLTRKDFIAFDKIELYEVNEYIPYP